MTIVFRCSSCGHKLRAPDGSVGRRAPCKCGQVIVVPMPDRQTSRPEALRRPVLDESVGRRQGESKDEGGKLDGSEVGSRSSVPLLLLAIISFGVAAVFLVLQILSATTFGPRLDFATRLASKLPLHLPIEIAFLVIQLILPVLLVFVGIRLIRKEPARGIGGLYGVTLLVTKLGYALYLSGAVVPATRELEQSITGRGPMTLSHGGHGLKVEGWSGTLVIPWEYTGVDPFLSWMDMLFILHAGVLLIILFVPWVYRGIYENNRRRPTLLLRGFFELLFF